MFEALNDEATDAKVREILEANIKIALERQKAQEALEKEQPAVETVHAEKVGTKLRQWPEEVAAMPTELTRVSLFGLIRRGRRKVMEWEKLSSRPDIEVSYFGKQLDQADADLWLACLRMGRGVPMGQRMYTTRGALLKEIGKTDGSANHKWLIESLKRMSGAAFELVTKRNGKTFRVTTGMLKFGIEETTGQMFIRLDPEGAALFENLAYIGWDQRLALETNAAKALQLYVNGHTPGTPHAVPVADLAHWMGYEGRIRQFRITLQNAMSELASKGLISSPSIRPGHSGDVASWVRSGKVLKAP